MSEAIPQAVLDLCKDIDDYPARVTEYSCVVDFHGLELRFQLSADNGWERDEIVGDCWLHIEQMTTSYYWIGISPKADSDHRVCVGLGAKRAALRMTGYVE
jgi:hypothetical protein